MIDNWIVYNHVTVLAEPLAPFRGHDLDETGLRDEAQGFPAAHRGTRIRLTHITATRVLEAKP